MAAYPTWGWQYLEGVRSTDELPDTNSLRKSRREGGRKGKESQNHSSSWKSFVALKFFSGNSCGSFLPRSSWNEDRVSSVLRSLRTASRRVFDASPVLFWFKVVSNVEDQLNNSRPAWSNHGRECLGLPSDVPALHLLLHHGGCAPSRTLKLHGAVRLALPKGMWADVTVSLLSRNMPSSPWGPHAFLFLCHNIQHHGLPCQSSWLTKLPI